MRLVRLCVLDLSREKSEYVLSPDYSHRVLHVLRCSLGAEFELFNASGLTCRAVLIKAHKASCLVSVVSDYKAMISSAVSVHLLQGVSRSDRMDFVIQKATELGVASISPVLMQRSALRLHASAAEKKRRHWQKIAIQASEQSGRFDVPDIDMIMRLDEVLPCIHSEVRLVCLPGASMTVTSQCGSHPKSVAVIIGPEGGIDQVEQEMISSCSFEPFGLGPRVLRTETAPLVVLSLLQYVWGDLAL